jgi:Cys-tRNA(Pro) deacylase
MTPLERVEAFLKDHPDLSVRLFDVSTHTSDLAAQALGVEVGQIAKSLVFNAGGTLVLVVTSGDQRVNTKKLAKALGVGKVRFADADTVLDETGFPVGGVSPVGLLKQLPIYLDTSLQRFTMVYAAAGTANSALPVTPERLRDITSGIWIDAA